MDNNDNVPADEKKKEKQWPTGNPEENGDFQDKTSNDSGEESEKENDTGWML